MRSDIRDALNQWSRWRHGSVTAGLDWPRRSMLGRMLDGMPGTNCPTCTGRGRVAGSLVRAHAIYIICPTCGGEGKVKLDPGGQKVNPAFISSTYRQPEDPQSERIDRLVCELRKTPKHEKYYFVLWAEYVKDVGTQSYKAEKMSISHDYYRKLLERAHRLIELGLHNVTNSFNYRVTK